MGSQGDALRDMSWLALSFSILTVVLVLYTRTVIAWAVRRFA